jgi:hypothetical protein
MKPYFVRLAIRVARERPMLGGGYGDPTPKGNTNTNGRDEEGQDRIAAGDAM